MALFGCKSWKSVLNGSNLYSWSAFDIFKIYPLNGSEYIWFSQIGQRVLKSFRPCNSRSFIVKKLIKFLFNLQPYLLKIIDMAMDSSTSPLQLASFLHHWFIIVHWMNFYEYNNICSLYIHWICQIRRWRCRSQGLKSLGWWRTERHECVDGETFGSLDGPNKCSGWIWCIGMVNPLEDGGLPAKMPVNPLKPAWKKILSFSISR